MPAPDYGRPISIAAMDLKHFRISPFPSALLAETVLYERVDVEPQNINDVRLTVGGKTVVIDGCRLVDAVYDAIAAARRRS